MVASRAGDDDDDYDYDCDCNHDHNHCLLCNTTYPYITCIAVFIAIYTSAYSAGGVDPSTTCRGRAG